MRDKCIITTVRDEATFLPLWLNYYTKHFLPEDIYIIDDGTTDGSTSALDPKVHIEKLNGVGQLAAANSLAPIVGERVKTLLESYRCVTFAEADDFLITDPQLYPGGLDDMYSRFLADNEAKRLTFEGWGVIHDVDNEPKLELDRPWLSQRTHWIRIPKWDNTLVFKTPPKFQRGYHYVDRVYNKAPNPGCMLIDMHFVDFDLCQARHKQRRDTYTNKTDYNVLTGENLKQQFFMKIANPAVYHNGSQSLIIGERFKTIL